MAHDHRHKGKSSERFLITDTVLNELDIRPGQTIIDAGCGNGYMAKKFAKRVGAAGKVIAVDPDGDAIKKLQGEIGDLPIDAMAADVTQPIAVDSLSVDLIYLSTVLHGFSKEQVQGFQREVHRLLKPGGRLAVVEIKKEQTPFGPPMEIRFSPEELKNAIHLTPCAFVEAGDYFYMQLFEKG